MNVLILILPILIVIPDRPGCLAGAALPGAEPLGSPAIVDTTGSGQAATPRVETVDEQALPGETGRSKSPSLAMLRSAVLPGWGQFYTGHPWRGSLILAAEGTLLAFAWSENRKADRNWETYDRTGEPAYFDIYEKHFHRANNLLSWAIVVFLYNVADAYVSAHLYDFDSKISFDEDRLEVSMTWKFREGGAGKGHD